MNPFFGKTQCQIREDIVKTQNMIHIKFLFDFKIFYAEVNFTHKLFLYN